MKKYVLQFITGSLLFFLSCKKEAGAGGSSFIKGKVFARYYDKNLYFLADSAYAPDVDVYIIYGNESAYGDHQKTVYDGTYEFRFLRKGVYKIYAYSRDTTGYYKNQANKYSPDVASIKTIEVTKQKQTVEVQDIRIIR